MQIKQFCFNPFQENTYVVMDDDKNALIIDPGCYDREEELEFLSFISEEKLTVLALLSTHSHIDHVLGNQFVLQNFQVPHYVHKDDIVTLESVQNYAHVYGFDNYKVSPAPTHFLKGGEKLSFGKMNFEVIHAPGHAPGHVIFYFENEKFIVNGDVLFQGSFGRTDLPGGSIDILKKTIKEKLFVLPEETVVFCGHGNSTTIGDEKFTNPILQY